MTRISVNEISVRPLTKLHKIEKFDCGDDDLNDFLKNDALKYQDELLARTFIVVYREEVVGFFSLTNDSIRLKGDEENSKRIPHLTEYPATKIARLATDSRCTNQGIGTLMVKIAFGMVTECEHSVCRFITVDSYASSENFYKRLGFKPSLHKKYDKKEHISMRFDLLNPSK